jgi:site-specific DNA-cytosine methylase
VFVVGCLGDWQRAAAVLFERHSLQGNPPPRREAGKVEGGHHYEEISGTLRKEPGDNQMAVATAMQVRRLTPRECERLQGFPDDYTQVPYRNKPAADGPRYKALGNSMAVPVMAWIGKRIQQVEDISA